LVDIDAHGWATKTQAAIIPPLYGDRNGGFLESHGRKEAKMHTVEVLDEAVALAARCGFGVRQDWFGGVAGGACEFKGQQWIFIDLALTPYEQLEQVLDALREFANLPQSPRSPQLQALLEKRKAA
jgi:hypothetical protein